MTLYLIYVIILTIALFIYYGYTISKDIYGKDKKAKTSEEVFELGDDSEDIVAVSVKENEDGFSVIDGEGEKIVVSPEATAQPGSTPVKEENKLLKKAENAVGDMYPTEVNCLGGITGDELEEMMIQENPVMNLIKVKGMH